MQHINTWFFEIWTFCIVTKVDILKWFRPKEVLGQIVEEKYFLSRRGAPFGKIWLQSWKNSKNSHFHPSPGFFFCIIYWYGLLKIISHKCLELWKKLNWAADKVYGDQKFGFHLVFSVHSQKYEFFRSVPFWIFLIPKSFSDFKNQFSSPKKPN